MVKHRATGRLLVKTSMQVHEGTAPENKDRHILPSELRYCRRKQLVLRNFAIIFI